MIFFNKTKRILGAVVALVFFSQQLMAVPPSPALLEEVRNLKKELPYFALNLDALHRKGVCTGEKTININNKHLGESNSLSPAVVGPFKILALLVDFSDNTNGVAATFFDSLIFDTLGNTIKDYYDEVSYGQLDLITVNLPSSVGWQRAPQTYAYYVNGENGIGAYPTNTQKLTEDLVDQVDSLVDFSNYDNDNNGTVDVLLIIHAGSGAEFSSSNDDIWSHKWAITPRSKDGVTISNYAVQPEFWTSPGDMTIGVYTHELGHGFGLPDLYDTDYSSYGIGGWGLMSYGSWSGPGSDGSSPTHPCAWSKIQMGFTTAINVTSNITSQIITNVENNQSIYRLWNAGGTSTEYFLIENRQKTGYDSFLKSSGLLIWHIDDTKAGNTEEWYTGQPGANHFLVALKQADGLYEIEQNIDQGDAADPYPGTTANTGFNSTSLPVSNAYDGSATFVSVNNIVISGDTVIADLFVGLSSGINSEIDQLRPGSIELGQNYPNPFNPSTSISFTTTKGGIAELTIYNVIGEKVTTLFEKYVSPGTKTIEWNGTDKNGNAVSSGIYFYRLLFETENSTKKMTLLK